MTIPRFTRAVVRPPASTFAQGITRAALGPPDLALALAQHEAYCRALESCGLSLTRLPADPDHPDSTFVEDTAVLTPRLAVLARPGAPERAGEVAAIRGAVDALGLRVAAIEAPGTLDGGDVCEAGGAFFVGISERTNEEGARQLAALLAGEGFHSTGVDVRGEPDLLHLKSGLAWLGGRTLAVTGPLAGRPEIAGWDLVEVDPAEGYAANCVLVNGRVLLATGFPRFAAALRARGAELVELETSEFRKMDGGLSCLSLRI